MSPIVLDASAAIELVLGKNNPVKIRRYIEEAPRVLSSSLYKAEVTNVLRKYQVAGIINGAMAQHLLALTQDLVDDYYDMGSFTAEALKESIRMEHSAYDMFYFTLARRFDARLVTMDKRLNRLAKSADIAIMER